MNVYEIRPQRFGEDAVAKEVRYIVATARAGHERVLCLDCRACSAYLCTAVRHALSTLKKDGIIELYFPASRFLPEKDQGAAFLLSRDPDAATEPLLAERLDGVFAVSL